MKVHVLARILCGKCAAEGQAAEILGRLEKTSGGQVRWISISKRRARLNPAGAQRPSEGWDGWRSGVVLRDPRFPRLDVPDELPAVCATHGWGSVSTADVYRARGRTALTFTASALAREPVTDRHTG